MKFTYLLTYLQNDDYMSCCLQIESGSSHLSESSLHLGFTVFIKLNKTAVQSVPKKQTAEKKRK